MILLADSGSTKTEWIVIEGKEEKERIITYGINPFFQNPDDIYSMLTVQLPDTLRNRIYENVYFYGAGCALENKKKEIASVLSLLFRSPIEVESDLTAAARSIFHNEAGIACILGTGSNSCFYDGGKIMKNVPPLGFILGDEGSGASLGKQFLADCLKNIAPAELIELLYNQYKLSYGELLDKVYKEPYPNRFLGSFAKFLIKYTSYPYVSELIYNNFDAFFKRCLYQYDYKGYPAGFIGSIAFYFSDILNQVAKDNHIQITTIEKSPVNGLINFHTR